MQDLVFVSAQPDIPYFHWQTEVYCNNFIEKGISPDKIHVIFAMVLNQEPTEQSLKLKNLGVNVHHYEDTRIDKYYIPSLRPMVMSRWLKDFPELSKLYFYHDSDIIFRKLPDFDNLINDDFIYLSNTLSYIGYDYIISCCKKYQDIYAETKNNELLNKMSEVVGIDIDEIKLNQLNSGGAQYLIKNLGYQYWSKVFSDCTKLYYTMRDYHKKYPISQGEIQMWTADMWAVLWNIWLKGKRTKITKELDFSWASDSVELYEKKPILHMAGVTESMRETKFFKGEFINKNPLELLRENENYFDYVDSKSATIKYIELMKSLVKKTLN